MVQVKNHNESHNQWILGLTDCKVYVYNPPASHEQSKAAFTQDALHGLLHQRATIDIGECTQVSHGAKAAFCEITPGIET